MEKEKKKGEKNKNNTPVYSRAALRGGLASPCSPAFNTTSCLVPFQQTSLPATYSQLRVPRRSSPPVRVNTYVLYEVNRDGERNIMLGR